MGVASPAPMCILMLNMEIFRTTPTTTGFHIDVDPVALYWFKILFLVVCVLAVAALIMVVFVPLKSARRRGILINCLGCGGGVSPHASTCPHCDRLMK